VSHNDCAQSLAIDKHSSLLGPFISYVEDERLSIWPLAVYPIGLP